MDRGRWQRVEALFHQALELPPERREAYLRAACAGDEALYNEVQALLAADETPHSLLEGRALDALGASGAGALAEGTRIGPYRIEGVIGTGGMGAVYLAARADGQFEQRVALKLIKRGMDSESILARFHAERRILARLQHPHIASLLDGGVTGDGLPFFTMEHVDGRPITEYCDESRLSIEERLDLFQSVCAAVQYAHGNLVVHRDLKPSNIFVTRDGHVKLLDFGIARVLDEDEDGLTRSGQRVMTPAYASPEQVRGEPVTTATDVYSLGVVLYELLCGRHPHRDTTSSPAELERAIADTPAERPSRFVTRIDTVGAAPAQRSLEDVARARRIAPARLHKRLAGDLDTICLVALRKEPVRRYASANDLLEDIRRHLAGRPVSARPDTARYRFGKFVRRNRAGVTAVAALVVLVTALTALYTNRLARERDRARHEAAKAAEVSAFLTGLFEAADPYTARGETITARELLDKGRDRVRSELADQPDVLAEMLQTIGEAYGNLGLLDEAIALLKESYTVRVQASGEHTTRAVKVSVRLMEVLVMTGAYEEAESVGVHAVAVARGLRHRPVLSEALGSMGQCLNFMGRFDEAESLYRESIRIFSQVGDADSANASPVVNNLALMLHEESRYAEADTLFQRALAAQERVFGVRHPETNTTRYNYAQLLSDEGNLSQARTMWDEVLVHDRALFPEGHPSIAFTLSAYGRLLARLGDYEEATSLQREALAIRRHNHGDAHPDIAYSLRSLGRVLHDQAFYEEAERCYRQAYQMHVALGQGEHPILSATMNDLGELRADIGDYATADSLFRAAFEFQRETGGEREHNRMAIALLRRADMLRVTGRLEEAEASAREGVGISDRLHEQQGMWAAIGKLQLAEVLVARGNLVEADSLLVNTLAALRGMEAEPVPRPRDIECLIAIGRCRLAQGNLERAEARLGEALDIAQRYLRAGHPETARVQIALAQVRLAQGRARDARALLGQAVDALAPLVLPGQADRVEATRLLAQLDGRPGSP